MLIITSILVLTWVLGVPVTALGGTPSLCTEFKDIGPVRSPYPLTHLVQVASDAAMNNLGFTTNLKYNSSHLSVGGSNESAAATASIRCVKNGCTTVAFVVASNGQDSCELLDKLKVQFFGELASIQH